jgi:hypothetical protein
MRIFALIGVLFVSGVAQAQNSFGNFDWKRDSRFEFQFVANGKGVSLKGNLTESWPDKTEVTVTDQGYELYIKVFQEGFAYAVVKSDLDENNGYVYLMELQNGFYVGMLKPAIVGRKVTVAQDVKGILEALNKANNWNVATAMRSMREYFSENPSAQLTVFFDEIEAGHIKQIPKTHIDSGAVDNGVVQLPAETRKPPKIQIEEPAVDNGTLVIPEEPLQPPVDQPAVEQGQQDGEPMVLVPPADIPNVEGPSDGDFTPQDMTQGWDGDEAPAATNGDPQWLKDERARQAAQRQKKKPVVVVPKKKKQPVIIEQPLDQDDDLF